MSDYTLPEIWTIREVAEYLKVGEEIVLTELETGSLHGFRIGDEWRSSATDLLNYISKQESKTEPTRAQFVTIQANNEDWDITEIGPFDFNWPRTGGGGNLEHYDKGYEATKLIDGQQYTFKIGFGNRNAAGRTRRRVTIWLGSRAIVEFAGSNDYKNDRLLAGVIRLKSGKQLTNQRIPEEYQRFRVERYNSIVAGPQASKGMAVVVYKDDLKAMLNHAVIRAIWKELI